MDEARRAYNDSLRSHPWTIAKAKDELRLEGVSPTDEALRRRIGDIARQHRTALSEEQAAARKRQVLSAIPAIGVLVAVAYGVEDLVREGDPTSLVYALPAVSSIATVVGGLRDIATGDHEEGARKLIRLVPVVGDLNEARHYAADGDVEMAVLMVANAVMTVAAAIKRRFLADSARGAIAGRLAGLPPGMLAGVRHSAPELPAITPRMRGGFRLPGEPRPFKNRVAPYRPGGHGEPPRRAAAPMHALELDAHIRVARLPEDAAPPDAAGIRRSPLCNSDQGYVEIKGRTYPAYRMHGRWHVERQDMESGASRLIPLTRHGAAWRLKTGVDELARAAGLERLFQIDEAPGQAASMRQAIRDGAQAAAERRGGQTHGDAHDAMSLPEGRAHLLRAASSGNFTVRQAQALVGLHPLSRFTDAEKGFVYRGFTFRGDMRHHAEIFRDGFRLRGEIDDIRDVNGFRGGFGGAADARDRDGRGISTSPFYDRDNAGAYYYGGHRGGYTYLIDGRMLEGYDLYRNWQYVLDGYGERRGAVSPRPWEVNYGQAISADRIVGAFDGDGRYFPNPHYRGTAGAARA
jgi:hypothetical protein